MRRVRGNRRDVFSLAVVLVTLHSSAVVWAVGENVAIFQEGLQAYQSGEYIQALDHFVRLLDKEPDNKQAQRQLWIVVKAMQNVERGRRASLSPKEREEILAVARRDMELRKMKVTVILKSLEQTYKRSSDARSPSDLLAAMNAGAHTLKQESVLEEGLVRFQAEQYFQKIQENLQRAMKENRSTTKKEVYSAQAYLAYYQKDLKNAVAYWELALKEDPQDSTIRENYAQTKTLLAAREKTKRLNDLANQGNVYFKSGYLEEALAAYQEVLKLDALYPGAAQNLARIQEALGKREQEKEVKQRLDEGMRVYRKGKSLDAAQIWLEALQIDPLNTKARYLLGMVSQQLQERSASNSEMEETSAEPAPPPKKEMSSAARSLPAPSAGASTKTGSHAEQAQVDYSAGIQSYMEGNLAKAMSLWERALQNDPDFVKARRAIERTKAQMETQ